MSPCRHLGTDVSGRIWLMPSCCRGSSGGMIEMPPQCTEMGMQSYDCSEKACDCGKRGAALSDFKKTTPRRGLEREAITNRTGHCGLWDVDAYDLAGSRRGCAEVRHVKLPIRAKGHGRRNDETGSDILDITVSLHPHNLAVTGSRITGGI